VNSETGEKKWEKPAEPAPQTVLSTDTAASPLTIAGEIKQTEASAVPVRWQEKFSKAKNKHYYVNSETGEKKWEKPAEPAPQSVFSTDTRASPLEQAEASAVPVTWQEKFNKAKNKHYYVNSETGEKKWEKPAEPSPDTRASSPTTAVEIGQAEASAVPVTWQEKFNKAKNKAYYENSITGEKKWTKPDDHALPLSRSSSPLPPSRRGSAASSQHSSQTESIESLFPKPSAAATAGPAKVLAKGTASTAANTAANRRSIVATAASSSSSSIATAKAKAESQDLAAAVSPLEFEQWRVCRDAAELCASLTAGFAPDPLRHFPRNALEREVSKAESIVYSIM
jgi:hypothetical protein